MCLSIPMIEIKTHHKYKYELTDRQHLNSSLPLHNISPDKSNINSAGLPAILAACQPVEGNRHIHTLPLRFMTPYSARHGTSDTPIRWLLKILTHVVGSCIWRSLRLPFHRPYSEFRNAPGLDGDYRNRLRYPVSSDNRAAELTVVSL